MKEESFGARSASPEQYLERTSATVLVLFKLLEAAAAGVCLFHLFRLASPAAASLAKGTMTFYEAFRMLAGEYGFPDMLTTVMSVFEGAGLVLPVVIWGGLVIAIVLGLFLILLDAIALLLLRTTYRGAGMIQVIHQFQLCLCVIDHLFFAYLVLAFIRYAMRMQNGTLPSEALIVFFFSAVIYLILLALQLCYHKDISLAMRTVRLELKTGKQSRLRKTHLSGISFLFCVPYVLLLVLMVVVIVEIRSGQTSLPVDTVITLRQYLTTLGVPLILIGKHLSVCFCNRNLKKSR